MDEFRIGVVPVDPNKITLGSVIDVLMIVRFLLLLPLLEPSMVTWLLNILIKAPELTEPDIVDDIPAAGRIVKVLTTDILGFCCMVIGNDSPEVYVDFVSKKTTLPDMQLLLTALKADVRVVKLPPVPTV